MSKAHEAPACLRCGPEEEEERKDGTSRQEEEETRFRLQLNSIYNKAKHMDGAYQAFICFEREMDRLPLEGRSLC